MAEKKKETELDKTRGQTEAQLKAKAYHEGDFQTTDPVTGEKRGPLMNWQDKDHPNPPIGDELSPADVKVRQKADVARSADAGAPAPKKPTGRKRKGAR